MTPEQIQAITIAMSSEWWASVALGLLMCFHFTWITFRDKSIEKRFSQMFDSIIEMEKIRASADLIVAKAMTDLVSEVHHHDSSVLTNLNTIFLEIRQLETEVRGCPYNTYNKKEGD